MNQDIITHAQPSRALARFGGAALLWRLGRIWLPAAPVGGWLARVLLAPWQRRDVEAYLAIVRRGYRADDGTAQFHPLLAWLATPITWLGAPPLLALLAVTGL